MRSTAATASGSCLALPHAIGTATLAVLLMVAPHFQHEYLRLPPLAVFSMRSPHDGHNFWSCFL
jgi:hypothetical protein